ncbi:MAG: hypothetical protein KDD63_24110 [Bacteroidetes bacterium]|nr:hypothetical protein [Bacteroidota bacterium]MCB0845978.1 hypothetical protein [Bacteroidota bacterium]MCB0855338.1 hypothetical protein [Bacteroidota bacterium]
MYHIIIHAKPTEKSDFYGEVEGGFAVVLIDYKDIDGAFELARFYVEGYGWEIIEVEDEYHIIETVEDMNEDYQEYFEEVRKDGYAVIFNTYDE